MGSGESLVEGKDNLSNSSTDEKDNPLIKSPSGHFQLACSDVDQQIL